MKKIYNITEINFESNFIIIKIDGQLYKLKLSDLSERLAKATDEEKRVYNISPSGYGIHWPKIDEDISIQSIIRNQSK